MHGIGKSQLTLYFAISSFRQRRYLYVFWISATTIAKLHRGFDKLLDLVDHRDRGHPNQQTRLTAAQRWLEQCEGKWLLVLDNVERDTFDFLQEHLPCQGKHGNILFTTRTKNLADSLANSGGQRHRVLALHTPSVQDATKLLLDHYEGEVDDEQTRKAQDIVNIVGRLPLAVAQASAFIKQTGNSLDEVLKLYESDRKFEMINWENDLSTYEAKSVAATFSRQLQDLVVRYPIASNLLYILSFLDPESIPLNMIIQGAEKIMLHSAQTPDMPNFTPVLNLIRSPIELQNAVTQLENRSLVQRQHDSGAPTLYIHDLVQFMVQVDVKKGGGEDHWYDLTVHLVSKAFASIEDPKLPSCWSDCESCLLHIRSLTVHQEMCGREPQNSLIFTNEDLSDYLRSRGRYDESEKVLDKVLAWKEKKFGPQHINTTWTLNRLGIVYLWRGKYDAAETNYERVLAAQEKHFGMEHKDTLGAMNNLAQVYQCQGRYDAAEKVHRQVLGAREELLGIDHPDILSAMNNLANVWLSQGRYDASETMLRRVVAAWEKIGIEHPYALICMSNLANAYEYQGRYDASEAMNRRVLAAQEKLLGIEHPETLTSMSNLADVLQSQGKYDTAETIHGRVLVAREKNLGIEHPETLASMNNLAEVYQSQGKYDTAETIHGRVLVAREKNLGIEHPDTLDTTNNLGIVYEAQNRFADAEIMYKRALAGRKKCLGVDHPKMLKVLRELSALYRAQGRFADADMLASRTGSHSFSLLDVDSLFASDVSH